MFIPLSEVETEYREAGEERNAFYFYKRDPKIPVEVKITRLPPHFDAMLNLHRHKYVEEFSVPLIGKIIIYEEEEGKIKERPISEALLKKDEWVIGVECKSTKRVTLLLEGRDGKRRDLYVEFLPEFTEGRNWHAVGNPTNGMVTMITLKRVARSVLKKDPMVFEVDREIKVL